MAIRHKILPFFICSAGIIGATILSGCVSVNIGPKGAVKSSDVRFQEPESPFESMSSTPADRAWQNTQNGNTISYLSSCNDPNDPPLDVAAAELTGDLRDATTLRSQTIQFNGREALDQDVEGKVEGVTTRIRNVIFKKNGCLYTLTYLGVAKAFEADKKHFEKFLKGFEAP
ncbi:MAG TPA: hypothetical protein VM432_00645 [Bdellovibrionales bacterium]|nr:hypothetical protein [Bdellovibrionales bacterium]